MTDHYDGHDRDHSYDQRSDDERTKRLAKEGAHEAVNEAFERLGIDTNDWHETQKDTAFLRKLRRCMDNGAMWIGRAVVTVLVGAMLAVIWAGFKIKVGK